MSLRHPLLVLAFFAFFPTVMLRGQGAAAPARSVSGFVHDEGNAPVADAELRLARKGEAVVLTRTGKDGRFSFAAVALGAADLSVRRMGYKAVTRSITVGPGSSSTTVDFPLQTVATDVSTVVVEGEDPKLHEFYVRRDNNSFGKYFDGPEIMRRDPRLMSELLRTVPGASIGASTRIGNRVLLRGCKPTIWVNGMKAFGAELDEVANPSDIGGLEVYLSWAGLPPQFQDRENPGCGAILVWTRDN